MSKDLYDLQLAIRASDQLMSHCRSCLVKSEEMMSLLDEPMHSAFYECTSIQINHEDGLSTHICLLCAERCEAAKSFRDLAIASDTKLKCDLEIVECGSVDEEEPTTDIERKPLRETNSTPSQDSTIEDLIVPDEDQEPVYEMMLDDDVEVTKDEEVVVLSELVVDSEVVVEEEDIYVTEDEEDYEQIVYEETCEDEGSFEEGTDPTAKSKRREPQIIQCEICDEVSNNRLKMTRHYLDQHPGKNISCSGCNRTFVSVQTWRTHNCSLSPMHCDICDKSFIKRGSYLAHCKTHTEGQRQFVCEICNKGFVNKFYYKTHVARHEGEFKLYECTVCRKTFLENSGMQRHYKLLHTNERPFNCELCPKKFAFDYMLKRHMQVHTGLRPFKCKFENCGVTLSSGNALKHHMYTHTGEKPYSCDKCDATFRIKEKLRQHKAKSHR